MLLLEELDDERLHDIELVSVRAYQLRLEVRYCIAQTGSTMEESSSFADFSSSFEDSSSSVDVCSRSRVARSSSSSWCVALSMSSFVNDDAASASIAPTSWNTTM